MDEYTIIRTIPTEKIVKISAAQDFDLNLVRENPAEMENYIRSTLALKLAEKLIEEDIISFRSDEDRSTNTFAVDAQIEAIQGE